MIWELLDIFLENVEVFLGKGPVFGATRVVWGALL